jgi:hypothetical protein
VGIGWHRLRSLGDLFRDRMERKARSEQEPERGGRKIMPKKVTISLHGVVNQIKAATAKLAKARNRAISGAEKQQLAVKIKNLEKIKSLVIKNCPKSKPAYGIIALVK